jgi:sulfopyruvate decarboxylase subunit beta
LVIGRPVFRLNELYHSYEGVNRCLYLTREEEAIAVASGMSLTGAHPLVVMRQSGVGNCLNAVFSLSEAYDIFFPILVYDRNCMGSMGSVIPLALGLTSGHRSLRVLALEGDGSLLMNLGTLVSVRRYGSSRIGMIIFDNRCYESTGIQSNQPEGFSIEHLWVGAGLRTEVAKNQEEIRDWIKVCWPRQASPAVLVIRSRINTSSSPRIGELSEVLGERFRAWLSSLEKTEDQ